MMNIWPWPSSLRNGHAVELSRRWLGKAREVGETWPRAAADYARETGDDLRALGRRAGRSTRRTIDAHTVETVVIVGLAAFALGWLARRMQESRTPDPTRARVRARSPRPAATRAS